jgi:uncharacterized repeat protein (TIGR03806 family)
MMSPRLHAGAFVLAALLRGAVAAAQPSIALELVTIADRPTHVWHAGDARLFILERDGMIRVHTPGQGVLPTPFIDLTTKVAGGGEQGLYAIAFHPAFATNGFFFVSYVGVGIGSVVARYRVSANPDVADPTSETIVFTLEQPGITHKGGQIAFGPDGYLYLSLGDGGGAGDAFCRTQQGHLFYGKLLRLDVDALPYGVPPDNPFVGARDPLDAVADEVWALGLRNPWRFSFDRQTGDLFIGDVGQDAREEIDYQPAGDPGGQNYGWQVMEGNRCADPDPIDEHCPAGTPSCFDPAYTPPIHEYPHGGTTGACAVIGGFVYRGTAIPALRGRYVFGDLCPGIISILEPLGPGAWGNPTQLLNGERALQSFGEGADGELYVATSSAVYRIVQGTGERVQSRLQQACINAVNRVGAEVSKQRSRTNAECIRAAGRRQLASLGVPPGDLTVRACLSTDVRGRVQRARTKLVNRDAATCRARPDQVPDFAYTSPATVSGAAETAALRLTRSLFGADPDPAIVFADTDAGAAACQAEVARRAADLLEANWRVALRGKRSHLSGTAAVDNPTDLGTRVLAYVHADGQGTVAGKRTKLGTALGTSCAGEALGALFPGECTGRAGTTTTFQACVNERVRCRFCRAFERFDGLAIDCDTFDDAVANGSCPDETAIVCGATGTGVNWAAAEFDCPELSQYRLFADPSDPTRNAEGGLPYDLTTSLFSDYAQKYRFVFLPPGTHATYHADLPFDFPVGTIISKTFSFAHDLRNLGLGEDVIETRLLVHRASGWEGLAYVWLPDMSRALLTPAGASVPVSWIDVAGAPRSTDYEVPSAEECAACHFGPGDDPIGPTARLLNRTYPYPGGAANQLDHWTAIGALSGAPPSSSAPRLPVWDNPSDGTLEARARAYLHVNCAHCHNPAGLAGFTGLVLRHDQPLDESYGICAEASDGDAGSGLTFAFVPGAPEDSIALFRMQSVADGVKMPELERSVVHAEGVALVEAWVEGLAGTCP